MKVNYLRAWKKKKRAKEGFFPLTQWQFRNWQLRNSISFLLLKRRIIHLHNLRPYPVLILHHWQWGWIIAVSGVFAAPADINVGESPSVINKRQRGEDEQKNEMADAIITYLIQLMAHKYEYRATFLPHENVGILPYRETIIRNFITHNSRINWRV